MNLVQCCCMYYMFVLLVDYMLCLKCGTFHSSRVVEHLCQVRMYVKVLNVFYGYK